MFAQTIETLRDELSSGLDAKTDASRFESEARALKKLIDKCARLEEFTDLYEKIVPPADASQRQMEEFMREHTQMKEIIRRFDATLSTCALKHEIIEYSSELKGYTKMHEFENFRS